MLTLFKMLGLYLLGQNCLHLSFKPYLSSETYSRKYEKLPNIVIHACLLQNKVYVENVWPANLALFIYVSTHCIETVKWLDFNRYSQLTRWCCGNASALCARGPRFNPRLRQRFFLCLIYLLLLWFYFFDQKHIICQKVCNSIYNVILFSILNILQDFWPIIRV